MEMNWQKFIGVMLAIVASSYIYNNSGGTWDITLAILAVGLGGVIYGDA